MTASTSYGSRGRAAAGFTLVEVAVALVIISLLLGSILVPLEKQIENRKYDETQRILDQAREAVIGFVAANGYFPCPADYAGVSTGGEALGGHASPGSCAASVTGGGTAGVYIGYLPAVTLGFTPIDANGYAVDAWGITANRIRYAVSGQNVGGATRPFVSSNNSTNGMRAATMSSIMGASLLAVCNTTTGSSATDCASAATRLTSNAIAVIWSLGPNAATTGGTSADEAKNAQVLGSADRVFIKRDKSNVTGSEFDDVVTWISPPTLFSRLLAAGQLP